MGLFRRKQKLPMISFTEGFETYTPHLIAEAWDFTDRTPEVEKLWVYVTNVEQTLLVEPVYKVGGDIFTAEDIDQAIPGIDTSFDSTDELKHQLANLVAGFYTQVRKEPRPTHMVIAFVTADEEMNADFSYDPIAEVEPVDGLDPIEIIFQQWLKRLKETGDDSAVI